MVLTVNQKQKVPRAVEIPVRASTGANLREACLLPTVSFPESPTSIPPSISINLHHPAVPAMPGPPRGHRRNLSTEISETARLDVIVPQVSDLDISEAITDARGGDSKGSPASNVAAVAHIAPRSHLFYG